MDDTTLQDAWDICEVEELEQFNGTQVKPAVFEPECSLEFEDRDAENRPLWDTFKNMDAVSLLEEPLDGRYRGQVYIPSERSYLSVRTTPDYIKIGPADLDTSFDTFARFIEQFENEISGLNFLGSLEQLD